MDYQINNSSMKLKVEMNILHVKFAGLAAYFLCALQVLSNFYRSKHTTYLYDCCCDEHAERSDVLNCICCVCCLVGFIACICLASLLSLL